MLKERINWIDWAKTICIFLVILGHSHIQESDGFITQFIYSFHMQYFFFLSGILCTRNFSVDSFKKDIRYIIIPYYTFGILNIIWKTILTRHIQTQSILQEIQLLIVGNDASVGPIWFLYALFICKQLFLIIKHFEKNNIYLFYLLFALSFLPTYFISTYQINIPFFADSALYGLPYFLGGYILNSHIEKLLFIDIKTRIGIALLLFVLALYLSYSNGLVVIATCIIGKSIFLYYINSIFAIMAITIMCTTIRNTNRHVITLSYGTIAILGFHGYFLTILNYYLPVLLDITPHSNTVPVSIAYSIISCTLCYFIIIKVDKYLPFPFGLKGNLLSILSHVH